jgi:hypothetical protein
MDKDRCLVEFLPDEKLGWVIKPGEGCEEVFEEVAKNQGPHSRRYLDVRRIDQPSETTVEKPTPKTADEQP